MAKTAEEKRLRWRAWFDRHTPEWKAAYKAKAAERARQDLPAKAAASREYYHKRGGFWTRLKYHYGISQEDYSAMLGEQRACCKGCGVRLEPRTLQCCVDHDHTTGEVRGLLCSGCNKAVGNVKDSVSTLRRLAEYLEAYSLRSVR